jgi:hypothetical protein
MRVLGFQQDRDIDSTSGELCRPPAAYSLVVNQELHVDAFFLGV